MPDNAWQSDQQSVNHPSSQSIDNFQCPSVVVVVVFVAVVVVVVVVVVVKK